MNAHLQCRFLGMVNRPFPSSTNSHFKKGAKCETLAVQMGFICVRIKSRFHINGFALNLALKQIKGLGPVQNGLLQAPVLIIGMSVIAVAGVRKTRVDCTCYIDCSKILQLQVRIAFAY